MKKLSRRQAVALIPALTIGTAVSKEALAASMAQPKRCGGQDYPSRFDNLQDLLVDVIRHAQRTGDKIIEANDGGRMVFGWIAVPRDGGWPSDDCPINHRWEIAINRIIRTGNRMDPRFKEAIVQVTNDQSWMMTGEKRRDFNARIHLVQIPPNLAPCVPSRELWDPYVDGPLAPLLS